MFKRWAGIAMVLLSCLSEDIGAQTIKMTVGQAGVNPGTSLYFIAQKENLFAKHGLEVKIVDTTTPAAVQAMLGGSMQLTLGAGPAFVTATLEGAPALCCGFFLGQRLSLRGGRPQRDRQDTRFER